MIRLCALLLVLVPVSARAGLTVIVDGSPPLPDPVATGLASAEATDSSLAALQDSLLQWYLAEGYPFAGAGLVFLSADTLLANVVPGRHAALEEARIEGAPRTRPSVFLRLLRLRPGEPYDREEVREWRGRLERLPFVESVGATGLLMGPYGDLVVVQQVEEGPQGTLSASLGWDGERAEGGAEALFTNLAGTARQLEISGAATPWGGLDARIRYREPWLLGIPLSVELVAAQETPESSWVNREGSLSLIWETDRLETSAGAGAWRGYPPDGSRESYDYGLAGIRYLPGRRVPQGWLGADVSIVARVGDLSDGSSGGGLLSLAGLVSSGHWYGGALGLGGELLAGGVMSGGWVEGLLVTLGGQETLRGYPEDAFTAVRYVVARPEASVGETSTRAYLFADLAAIETMGGSDRFPAGCGAGLRGGAGAFRTDVAAGFPILEGIGNARVYLRVAAAI